MSSATRTLTVWTGLDSSMPLDSQPLRCEARSRWRQIESADAFPLGVSDHAIDGLDDAVAETAAESVCGY
jgi:hypothetical protein